MLFLNDTKVYIILIAPVFLERFIMLFLQISRHSIESCPRHNEKVKKVFDDSTAKMESLLQKHGIKMVGAWAAVMEHLFVAVYDAPSMDALLRFSMEPEMMDFSIYNETQLQPIVTIQEAMKMMK